MEALFLLIPAFPVLFVVLVFWLLPSLKILHPQEELVVLYWGKYRRTIAEPGIHFVNILGRKIIRISTKQQTIELPKNTVADGNGNPIIISGIVTFVFRDTQKAALEVEEPTRFVHSQAQAVLKQIASQYPYESKDGHSLKAEAEKISEELRLRLQEKVAPAGAFINSFELNDLAYAPEIAQNMLIRQQAMALVDARKIIVEGAVEIVNDAVAMLGDKRINLDEDMKSRLIVNLLTVICGDSKVQPTVAVSADKQSS